MAGVREYILSVTAAAILCACVRSIVGEKGGGQVLKLVCGLFLAFTAVRPIAHIEIQDFAVFTADIQSQADAAVLSGEAFARESLADIIKTETEAYILDKAQDLHAAIQVNVSVRDEDLTPSRVQILGRISPYAKGQLQAVIEKELGISKEDQIWME